MSSIEYKDRVRQALQAMPQMTADEFYSQMSRSMGTPLKYIKMTEHTLPHNSDNVVSQNYGISFRSKTEAIEQLCLKVFGATPVYGTDIEDFKAEASEEITKLEAELNKAREQFAAERELANRLEEENADLFLRRWAKAQERAIDAERERDLFKNRALEAMDDYVTEVLKNERLERALKEAWYIMDTIEGNDAVDEWQNKYSKYIESDYISCPECDALASHGVNDGPCEKHNKH